MKMGDRVALVREGRVAFTRSGFAAVRWDDGERTTEWIPDLTMTGCTHPHGSAASPTGERSPEGRLDGYDTREDGRSGSRQ